MKCLSPVHARGAPASYSLFGPLVPLLFLRVTIREVRSGDLRKKTSLDWINEELSKKPDDVGLLYSKGAYLAKTGDHLGAIDCFERITQLDPDHRKGWIAKAKAHFRIGEYEKSIESLDVLISMNPDDEKLWYEKGESLLKLGRFQEANECYDKAIEIDQNYADAWCGKGNALKGLGQESPSGNGGRGERECGREELFENALECFRNVLALDPQHHRAMGSKGILLCKMGNHENGLRDIDMASKADSGLIEPLLEKARLLESWGREMESREIKERVLGLPFDGQGHESVDHLLWKSKVGIEIGRHESAIQTLDRILEINPRHVEALVAKGNALSQLGSKEEALPCYDQALSQRPEMGEVWLLKGKLERELGMLEKSLLSYQNATSVVPFSTDAWFQRSMALYSASELRDALRSLLHVLRLDSSHSGAIGMKDRIESELFGRIAALPQPSLRHVEPDKSLPRPAVTSAFQRDGPTHDELVSMGIRLFSQKEYQEALVCFDDALRIDDEEYTVWDWKGDTLVKLDRYSEAIECYDRAVKLKHRHEEECDDADPESKPYTLLAESDRLPFAETRASISRTAVAPNVNEYPRTDSPEDPPPVNPDTEFLIDREDWLILNSLLGNPRTIHEISLVLQTDVTTIFPRVEALFKQGLLNRFSPVHTLAKGGRRINLYQTNRTTYEILRT